MADSTPQGAQLSYQATQITTATKEQLLLITYDIGIRSCRLAEASLDKKSKNLDYDLAHREILRAEDVIRELMVTLNTEKGGEMAQNLMKLYDYMHRLLVEANISKEPKNIAIVRAMLEELKETWEGALMKLLKEYQAAHPEDEDFKSLKLKDINAAAAPQPGRPVAPRPPSAPQKPGVPDKSKAGGLNIAG
jgi:flagellar protein FliS